MTTSEIKALFQALKLANPKIAKITIAYNGEGDTFSGYHDYILYDENDETISGPILFEEQIEPALDFMIDKCNISFNDSGSEGSITLDLKKMIISIDDYYIIHGTEPNISAEIELSDVLI